MQTDFFEPYGNSGSAVSESNAPCKVVFAHNPQEFFTGLEPPELTETAQLRDNDDWAMVRRMVAGGYKAIIFPGGDEE